MTFEQRLEGHERAMQVAGGRVFQLEGIAKAKTLWQECAYPILGKGKDVMVRWNRLREEWEIKVNFER